MSPESHLSAESLRELDAGKLGGRRLRETLRHLSLCGHCRELTARGEIPAEALVGAAELQIYEGLIARLSAASSSAELRPAELFKVANEVERCAEQLPMPVQADAVARALLLRSTGHRIAGSLDASHGALQLAALEYRQAPTLELSAELLRTKASLMAAQRQWVEAIDALRGAATAYAQIGDVRGQLGCQIKSAIYCGYAQDPGQAAGLLEEALVLACRLDDRKAGLAAAHSLAWFLVELGDVASARQVAEAANHLYAEWATANSDIKRRWLDGRILYQTGSPLTAGANLLRVAEEFAAAGARHDSGLAYLDASAAFATAGTWERSYELAWKALAILSEIGDPSHERSAALSLLRQALEAGQLQSLCFHRTSLAMAVVL